MANVDMGNSIFEQLGIMSVMFIVMFFALELCLSIYGLVYLQVKYQVEEINQQEQKGELKNGND